MARVPPSHPARRLRLALALLAAALLAPALALPRPAAAAPGIVVSTTADELNEDGDCSLREALRAANRDQASDACPAGRGADTIILPAGVFRLNRGGPAEDEGRGGDLDILRDLTVRGAGPDRTFLVAEMRDRVFDLLAPAVVTIEGLAMRDGAPAAEVGGCVRSAGDLTLVDVRVEACSAASAGGLASLGDASRLTLLRSAVVGNTARADGLPGPAGGVGASGELRIVDSLVAGNSGSFGAGVYSAGRAEILRSTVASNSAVSAVPPAPGDGLGGGVFSTAELSVVSSTISRNRAAASGGAGIFSRATLRVRDSTIVLNESSAPADPAAASAGVWALGAATVGGSILAGNREDGLPDDCAGLISLGGNLFQSPCAPADPTDLIGVDPLLGPLRANGSLTLTHATLDGSPARDAGFGCEQVDQRGVARPAGAGCDIGALEHEDALAPLAPPLRDDFAGREGRLSSDWAGLGRPGYQVSAGSLSAGAGGAVYWVRERLGQSQAASVTLQALDRSGPNIQGLLLKVRADRGPADWRAGAIRVSADGLGELRVEVYRPALGGWRLARAFPAALADGARLGARAFADGSVAVYLDGALVGLADTRDVPGVGEHFVGVGGYAGLWFERAPGALADDFAAGT